MSRLIAVQADITQRAVDAIVNAANQRLLGGGGVDGAIHRAAGPELLDACRELPEVESGVRCPTGDARITPAFALPAKWVIHTVGPVYRNGQQGEPELLVSCYQRSMELALDHKVQTIAFPAISCGVYGYPAESAAKIAVSTLRRSLQSDSSIEQVELVAFDQAMFEVLAAAVDA